jgi:hypothetical protein
MEGRKERKMDGGLWINLHLPKTLNPKPGLLVAFFWLWAGFPKNENIIK